MNKKPNTWFSTLSNDVPASLVVFLVAVPLCLGIALASGAPLIAGVISGIIGGVLVGALSRSQLGVSGPAAGLAVIVISAIQELGQFEVFLVALILAGILQLCLGYARAGIIAYYFPSSVINGMLSGIGLIIILKQIPHAFGYDGDPEGDVTFAQVDGENTFTELLNATQFVSLGATLVACVSLGLLLIWETDFVKRLRFSHVINGPLVAVACSVGLQLVMKEHPQYALSTEHTVSLPITKSWADLMGLFTHPDFSHLNDIRVYNVAFVIAIVASLETLLCVEATDKLDPHKRLTPTNRELKAQGLGNIVSGMLGGLPITQVIVRSSANIQSGGRTKLSSILHGVWILMSLLLLVNVMNLIPLAALAAILCVVGYKLAKPVLFVAMYRRGFGQFVPFIITVIGIVFTDLLRGIGVGMVVAIFVVLLESYQLPFKIHNLPTEKGEHVKIVLAQQVTFLNKASILKSLTMIPAEAVVEIDAKESYFIHPDVIEIIDDFASTAKERDIKVHITGLTEHKEAHASPGMLITVSPKHQEEAVVRRKEGS